MSPSTLEVLQKPTLEQHPKQPLPSVGSVRHRKDGLEGVISAGVQVKKRPSGTFLHLHMANPSEFDPEDEPNMGRPEVASHFLGQQVRTICSEHEQVRVDGELAPDEA